MYSSEDMANFKKNYPINSQHSLEKLKKNAHCNLDQNFKDWKSSGLTYMIPPAPVARYLGPTDENASGFDRITVQKKGPIISGDSAEAIVHKFLAESKQHAFVLQNFSTQRWTKILPTQGYDSLNNFWGEIIKLQDMEIDFLVLHAYAGVIGIECKAVETFDKRRYNESKIQLSKIDTLIEDLYHILVPFCDEKEHYTIPLKKVISFPFVNMRQNVKNLHNLGKADLNARTCDWWDRVLESRDLQKNMFETDILYQDLISILLTLYTAVEIPGVTNVMDIYQQIDRQSIYKDSAVYKESQFNCYPMFFLNPEQMQAFTCDANCQFIFGEVGTGKTILLIEKALTEATEGDNILFLIPRSLEPKYKRIMEKNYHKVQNHCGICSFEDLPTKDLALFDDSHIFMDEFQQFLHFDCGADTLSRLNDGVFEKNEMEESRKKLLKYFCNRSRRSSLKTVMVCASKTYDVKGGAETILKILDSGFELLQLNSIVRGTSNIVNLWKEEDPSHFYSEDCKAFLNENYPRYHQMIYWNKPAMAHNIKGCIVEKDTLSEIEFRSRVLEIVRQFTENSEQLKMSCNPKVICVITDDGNSCKELVQFLSKNGFPAGSIAEQVDNPNLVAVDTILQSLSFEWPVVVFARFHQKWPEKGNRFLRTVGSRAICQLHFFQITQKSKKIPQLYSFNTNFWILMLLIALLSAFIFAQMGNFF